MLLSANSVGLPKDFVANVAQLATVDHDYLVERAGRVPAKTLARVEDGVRLAFSL